MTVLNKCFIHPSAIIDPSAVIADGTYIGPYCIIGPNVLISKDVRLESHVIIEQNVTIGKDSTLHSFAVIGGAPQHTKYNGEPTTVIIGERNIIREHVTIHRGTTLDKGQTIIGNDCMLMVGVHVAHDCVLGNNITIANYTQLAGHVHIEDGVIIGGMSSVHQFARIGKRAMIGGNSGIHRDIIPYALVIGQNSTLRGLNIVGLKRMGMTRADLTQLTDAFKLLFVNEESHFEQRLQQLVDQDGHSQAVQDIIAFIQAPSKRKLTHKQQCADE